MLFVVLRFYRILEKESKKRVGKMRGSDGGKAERFIPLATVELREVEKLCHPLQHPFMTSCFTHFKTM